MNTLHTVNKGGHPLTLCLRAMADSDALLLIEEGVYTLLTEQAALKGRKIYALKVDVEARGIPLPESIKAVDYDQFVALTIEYDKTVSWF